jgi:RNA polymerase sigma-70 factor, ECF subfamily
VVGSLTTVSRADSSHTLEDLLELVAGGDRAAFALVYDKVADMVYGLARRVVVDRDLAADVAQEVLVDVWRKAHMYDRTRGTALAWIGVMTRRRAVDQVRSVEASRRRDTNQKPEPEPPDPVAEMIVESAERAAVQRALGQLSDLQRESVELAFYGGLTHREVAERLAVPLGTVKTRIRDGLTRLSGAMDAFARD